MYSFLGINQGLLKTNQMLALMPKHNPSPTFIFDKNNNCVFSNLPAQEKLEKINSIDDIDHQLSQKNQQIISNDKQYSLIKEFGDLTYLITFVGLSKEKLSLAYAIDITEAVKADKEIIQTQKEVVYTMGEIGETRSKETGYHVKRVAEYSALIAEKLGMSEEEVNLIKMASPMHDIGKVGIPDSILLKPGKLTAEEWDIMKTHTTLGYNLLKHSDRPILKASAIIAKEHHEKFNGTGYPQGLSGKDIHVYARITAVADVFDALGSDRVYKSAWPIEKIMRLFKDEKGQHFDPEMTEILEQNLNEFLSIRDAFQDTLN